MTAGEVVIAVLTVVCSGGAAYVGARASKRSTDVEDKRERERFEAERVEALIHAACSTNPIEAEVGLYRLNEAKSDWNDDPRLRLDIKRTLVALSSPAVQAYRGGATTVQTTSQPATPSVEGGS